MAWDYGYGKLEDQLIDLFHSGPPDFAAAEELIRQGAAVNAVGKEDDENILSEILCGYWVTEPKHTEKEDADSVRGDDGASCGPAMCEVIRFFLAHGFDVTKRDGCFGAQCLSALSLSSFDRYMIEATKLLLDAGAVNRTVSPDSTDIYDTPRSSIGCEGSFQGCVQHDFARSDIYEAVYQVYLAAEDGRPYHGIDSFELAVGKRVQRVLAECRDGQSTFFPLELPGFRKNNCYRETLYFVYDGGMLITTQYADFWTDTVLPDVELTDVSGYFPGIVGDTIRNISHDSRTITHGTRNYTQPIVTMEMASGCRARFTINFGEVEETDQAAFYELLTD